MSPPGKNQNIIVTHYTLLNTFVLSDIWAVTIISLEVTRISEDLYLVLI